MGGAHKRNAPTSIATQIDMNIRSRRRRSNIDANNAVADEAVANDAVTDAVADDTVAYGGANNSVAYGVANNAVAYGVADGPRRSGRRLHRSCRQRHSRPRSR